MHALYSLCAEALSVAEIEAVRVDRDDVLTRSLDILTQGSDNILISGPRGAGKTFIVRLIESQLRTTAPSILPVYVTLTRLMMAKASDDFLSQFPEQLLAEICRSMWVGLLGRDYMELRKAIMKPSFEITFKGKDAKTIIEVYRLVMTSVAKVQESERNLIGGAAVVKAEKEEETSSERTEKPLLAFEFVDLVRELKKYVLQPKKIDKLVVLCDEANRLPLGEQKDLLARYIEIFSSTKVQFLFVVSSGDDGRLDELPFGFQNVFSVVGLATKDLVRELIARHLTDQHISITEGAVAVLWKQFSGHPTKTLFIVRDAVFAAQEKGQSVIDARLINRSRSRLGKLV